MERKKLQKTSKYIEQVIQFEFKGNLDQAIQKMKKCPLTVLTEENKEKLKVCLLFLHGMSFSQISSELKISKGNISRILNDAELPDMLSFEYQVLLEKNRFRLKNTNIESNIKKAVEVFVEQNGNYQKTEAITGFSARTLSRYLQAPDLEQLLEDNELYKRFLEVKKNHISEIKSEAATENIQRKRDREQLEALTPNGIVQKRYLLLCRGIIVERILDKEALLEYTNMSEKNMMSYLEKASQMEGFLPQEIIEILNQTYLSFSMQKSGFLKEEFYKMILELYMDGRFSSAEIMEITNIGISEIKKVFSSAGKILSPEKYALFLEHKNGMVYQVKKNLPRDKYLVKDPRMVELLKKEVLLVDSKIHRLLNLVIEFKEGFGKIECLEDKVSFEELERVLYENLTTLEEYLKPDVMLELKSDLYIEVLLHGNELSEKYNFIVQMVYQFFLNDFNFEATALQSSLSITSLIHVLQDDFVRVNYGDLIYQSICHQIKMYRQKEQAKQSQKMDYRVFLKGKRF